ncbi:hypothetical protein SOVF_158450, partial [Spinacia oleracea]
VDEVRKDPNLCGCYMRYTHGLPCAHEMMEMEADSRSIGLCDIHPFWKTFKVGEYSPQDNSSDKFVFQCRHDIDKVLHSYCADILNQSEERKKQWASQLEKMIHPHYTRLKEPVPTTQPKGRPSTKNSTKRDLCSWEFSEQECAKYARTAYNRRGKTPQQYAHTSVRGRGRPPSHVPSRGRGNISVRGQARSNSSKVSSCGRNPSANGRGQSPSPDTRSKNNKGISPNIAPWVSDLPFYIVPHINYIHDVIGDGNCGYRVIARWTYGDEHRWPTIRQELAT